MLSLTIGVSVLLTSGINSKSIHRVQDCNLYYSVESLHVVRRIN